MRNATALRIEPDTSSTDLVAERRREALAKQLRKTLPVDELADLFQVDDQLAALDDRVRTVELGTLVSGTYIADLHEKNRARRDEHDALEERVDEMRDRLHVAFKRADEVMDGHSSDIDLLVETSNIHSRQINDQARVQRSLEIMVGEKIILSQIDRDRLMRHEAEMAEFRRRLEAFEARQPRQTQDKPLPRKKDGLPISAQIVLWTGALATAGYAIYSFIA